MCISQLHNKPIYKIAMNVLLVSLISEFNDFQGFCALQYVSTFHGNFIILKSHFLCT